MISHYHAVHPELNPALTHTRPDSGSITASESTGRRSGRPDDCVLR
jgi:hypothetical protein